MNDDWRVQVSCPTAELALELAEQLRSGDFEHGLEPGAHERVIVSLDGRELFLYAGSRAQAELAAAVAARLAPQAASELRRWDSQAEEWVAADGPAHLQQPTAPDTHPDGARFAEYEVRVSVPSHRQTLELAEALRAQGIPCLRRWRYLLIGAGDAPGAEALAERVRALASADARVEVEATAAAVAAEVPANPFAVFGGLGG